LVAAHPVFKLLPLAARLAPLRVAVLAGAIAFVFILAALGALLGAGLVAALSVDHFVFVLVIGGGGAGVSVIDDAISRFMEGEAAVTLSIDNLATGDLALYVVHHVQPYA
jgi:hypothetical protein